MSNWSFTHSPQTSGHGLDSECGLFKSALSGGFQIRSHLLQNGFPRSRDSFGFDGKIAADLQAVAVKRLDFKLI